MLSHLFYAFSLLVAYILQITIFSQAKFISGSTDLILLVLAAWSLQDKTINSWIWTIIIGIFISLVSATPFFGPLIAYIGMVSISKSLQRKVWQIPLLAMLIVVFLGTLFQHIVYVIVLLATGVAVSISEGLDSIILPSLLLNLLFSLPVFAIVTDLAGRISPQESKA